MLKKIYANVRTHLCEARNLSRNDKLLPAASSEYIEALSGGENLLQTDGLLRCTPITCTSIAACTPAEGW